MPICQTCGHRWSWKTTLKKSFSLADGMICPNCGATQYLSKKSRKRINVLSFLLPPLILVTNWFLQLTLGSLMIFVMPLLIVVIVTYPLLYELSNDNEPMW